MTRVVFRDAQEFKAWNDTMVEKYDIERFHDHPSPFVRYVEGKRIRRTFALLAPGPRDRVLEVGCGAGHLLERLPAGRRFGLDLSESMLRKAQRRVDPGTLLQANAESLPFRTGAWKRFPSAGCPCGTWRAASPPIRASRWSRAPDHGWPRSPRGGATAISAP